MRVLLESADGLTRFIEHDGPVGDTIVTQCTYLLTLEPEEDLSYRRRRYRAWHKDIDTFGEYWHYRELRDEHDWERI